MAKKTNTNDESNDFAGALADGQRAESEPTQRYFPDENDFTEIGGALTYTKPEPGLTVRGMLIDRRKRLGRSIRKGGDYYYAIELTEPCKAFRGGGDEVEEITAMPGETVIVDERASTEVLADLVRRVAEGSSIEVIIRCVGEKMESRNGQQFWPFKVQYRVLPV